MFIKSGFKSSLIVLSIAMGMFLTISCQKEEGKKEEEDLKEEIQLVPLSKRPGTPPETTTGIPHVQKGVQPVPEVHEELFRRVYSVPGIEQRNSVISGWEALYISEGVNIKVPEALIGDREYAHIHQDGSLHIFLEASRSKEAVEMCWASYHPFALENRVGWDGFVMLYTPQSMEELDVTFQLIVDGFNYVTGQNLKATDYYD